MTTELSNIYNYLSVTPTIATAGQPTRAQFAAIAAAGYSVVINLAADDPPHALADEADVVRELGIEYFHIPIAWTAPTTENLEAFFAAMQRTREKKRFVHCIANMRASAFTFLYRVLIEGIEPDEAAPLLYQIWQPNPTWAAFIDDELERRDIEW
ncbi:MAG: protein tyrosine phosphatase family protein [Caldilineaceae bacterium]|nr:protein tyrosine phosphatase family protein [Caldilineaceae bacterium]